MSRRIAVLGDLHYEPEHAAIYRAARSQLLAHRPELVFQLGDQGGYTHCGTWRSFQEGLDFLSGFQLPWHTLIGNHDLESRDYATDADAVAAWCSAFQRSTPDAAVDLGEALAICLSSTRCRLSPACHQEVYLNPEQVAWFEDVLALNRDRPTFVFAHVPILGSGLRVLQSVHLRCPNAWLNHSEHPEQFIQIVRKNPQIKLWFSAHNHLGQYYPDSISHVGSCTFVHTGVIGPVSRDGCQHSRFVEFDARGFVLSTVDHATGELVSNLRHDYAAGDFQRLSPHAFEDGATHFAPPVFPLPENRLECGPSAFTIHRGMVVEFDRALEAPLGVVVEGLKQPTIRLERQELHVIDADGATRVFQPNKAGRYLQVFVPNPWISESA